MSRIHDGSQIISAQKIRVADHPFVVSGRQHSSHQPVVTLRREGDVIREIQIQCGCGEVIVLDCEYGVNVVPQSLSGGPRA
ncbi:hypothetical protein [Planctomicrobium sp. SH527]|uniref:hypothetical protein n=1 Tax=Planctomicrobium sp. SH527 TaxID=3448123 RepID=UPI003F5BB377